MKTVLGVIIAKNIASEYQPLAYFLGYAFACLIGLVLLFSFSLLAIKVYHAFDRIVPKITSIIRGHSKLFVTNKPSQQTKIGPKTRDAAFLPSFLYALFSILLGPLILTGLAISALLIAIPLGSHDGKWFSIFYKPSFESDFTDCVDRDARKNAIEYSKSKSEKTIAFWRNKIEISVFESNQTITKSNFEHDMFVRQYKDTHPDLVKTSRELHSQFLQRERQSLKLRLDTAREIIRKTSLDSSQKIAKLLALSTQQYCYERIFEESIGGINWYYKHFLVKSMYRQLFHGETKEFWENTLSRAL